MGKYKFLVLVFLRIHFFCCKPKVCRLLCNRKFKKTTKNCKKLQKLQKPTKNYKKLLNTRNVVNNLFVTGHVLKSIGSDVSHHAEIGSEFRSSQPPRRSLMVFRFLRISLNIDPFLMIFAPLESSHSQLSNGAKIIKNGSIVRKIWKNRNYNTNTMIVYPSVCITPSRRLTCFMRYSEHI